MLKLDEAKLENSIALIAKHFNADFCESTIGLGQALNSAEDNQLNSQALDAWKQVQALYNEAVPVVKSFMDETQKVYDVAEFLRTKFDPGKLTAQSIDETMGSIDAEAIMFS